MDLCANDAISRKLTIWEKAMSLTKYGEYVRELRRQLSLTLSVMAEDMRVSPAFLSAMETGRNKVPADWAKKIFNYFASKGLPVSENHFLALADEANGSISTRKLPPHHRMLVAGFANSDLSRKNLQELGELLDRIYKEEYDSD